MAVFASRPLSAHSEDPFARGRLSGWIGRAATHFSVIGVVPSSSGPVGGVCSLSLGHHPVHTVRCLHPIVSWRRLLPERPVPLVHPFAILIRGRTNIVPVLPRRPRAPIVGARPPDQHREEDV